MDRSDRTSLDNWIEYKEYEASRAEIEGGYDSDYDYDVYDDDAIIKTSREIEKYHRQNRYRDVVFGQADESVCDKEALAELIVEDEEELCQLAIELYDWATADKEKYVPKEVAISDNGWDWMKAVYDREQWYAWQYHATLFDKGPIAVQLPIKRLIYTATTEENASSQTIIGELFQYGTNGLRGQRRAFAWYKKAAVNGYAEAQYRLGNCYHYGVGAVKNDTQAIEWWRKAAQQDHGKAMESLGHQAILKGDYKNAMYWLIQAAEQELPLAEAWLGILYEHGLGVEKDREKAKFWFKRAGHNKLIEAQVWMKDHSADESAEFWEITGNSRREKEMLRYEGLLTSRRSYRKLIADSVVLLAKYRGGDDAEKLLGKRVATNVWWYRIGLLILIALIIKGCM